MNYQQALDFILSRSDFERSPGYNYAGRFDLRRMYQLLAKLGNPHRQGRAVHIAGSKGKGSTSAMIASGLAAAGYRTGLYTSPHLHTIRERIAVDGRQISRREFAEVVGEIQPQADEVDREARYGQLTTFELLTAAAFLYFARKNVDFQVLETGLGGRLDATNVAAPEVCVITSISFDHKEVLGDTLAKIAAEKAGIIKPGALVVSEQQAPEAAAVIAETCRQKGTPLLSVGQDITVKKTKSSLSSQTVQFENRERSYPLTIPLLGDHQLQNAAAAAAALQALGISEDDIRSGLAKTRWPGRLQVLRRRPLLIVDGAHNSDSANKLRQAIGQYFHFDHLTLIIGVSGDKDVPGIVAELAPMADRVIATRSSHPRALAPEAIVAEFARHGVWAEPTRNVAQAVEAASAGQDKKRAVCATGSLFLVAEVIQYVNGIRGEHYS